MMHGFLPLPPDFMMDVISGQVPKDWKAQHPDFTAESLFKYWTDLLAKGKPDFLLSGDRNASEQCT